MLGVRKLRGRSLVGLKQEPAEDEGCFHLPLATDPQAKGGGGEPLVWGKQVLRADRLPG